ncbi:hypothetical protein [Streptomyces viridosporus]|uniref:hypothetical protein n=1 Tax=Streptomyces viridosporus TaxID=67581 RepID=UPI00331B0E57
MHTELHPLLRAGGRGGVLGGLEGRRRYRRRLGAAGRRPGDGRGSQGGGYGRALRDRAVAVVLAELRKAGGYRRGMAARLAREHGGGERGWQRAVTEARARYEQEHGQDPDGQDGTGPVPQPAL